MYPLRTHAAKRHCLLGGVKHRFAICRDLIRIALQTRPDLTLSLWDAGAELCNVVFAGRKTATALSLGGYLEARRREYRNDKNLHE